MKLNLSMLIVASLCALTCLAAESLTVTDFGAGSLKPFKGKDGVAVAADASGNKALKVLAEKWANAETASGLPADWSAYDLVKIECFNPGDKNIKMTIQIRDELERGYWSWHNRYVALSPGANTIQFAVADLWRGEVLRNDIPGSLDPKKITGLNIICDHEFELQSLRLESFPASKVDVPGLKAFKVGPAKAPGFAGFTKIDENSAYKKEKGFGWLKSGFARLDDRLHPDNLFRSWISCQDAELAVDVPNGKYRVHLQLEDSGYWEFMQHYQQRQVLAEGKSVIDEKMDGAEFNRRYYLNEDAEDIPSEDPFEKYVQVRMPWHTFDVDVADGQLNLTFKSQDTYANTLSAVIIYPFDQAEKGVKFLDYVKELRRFDWAQRWKPVSKMPAEPKFSAAAAAEASREGFVLYAFSTEQDHAFDHTPADSELIKDLEVSALPGAGQPLSFGMRPAKALGKVEVACTEMKNDKGVELPPESVSIWCGRYRFSRYSGQSGLYCVQERELRPFNRSESDTLRADNGLARRFWIHVQVPATAEPGSYQGTLTVKTEKGGTRALPFKLNVLPIKLPEPGHLFTLYGIDIMPQVYFPEMKTNRPLLRQALYRDLRSHGINAIMDLNVAANFQNGKAVVSNVDEVDHEMALRKKLGFEEIPVAAPGGASLDELSGTPIHGLAREQFINGWHKELTDLYKAHGWPKPYFCYGDEPSIPETLNKLTAVNKAVHAVSPDIWMGIAYHVQSPESYELLKTLDVHHFKAFCALEDFKKAKAAGKFLLNCNVGDNRAAFGLREWRAMKERQTDGCITYSYTGNHVDIYYDLDGREGDYMMAPPRRDGSFVTSARWERIREGVDDFRYARALEKFTKDPEAAQKLLEEAMEIGGIENAKTAIERAIAWRAKAQALMAK